MLCEGYWNDTWRTITKGKNRSLQLACGIGGDAFESRLEDAVQFCIGGNKEGG